jgi:hypothetical protein
VLGEPFEWRIVIGGALTAAGIAGVNLPAGRRSAEAAAEAAATVGD